MSYASVTYLLLFLPATALAYHLAPGRGRWIVLLAASWIFSALCSRMLVLYLLGCSAVTYFAARSMDALAAADADEDRTAKKKRAVFAAAAVLDLGVLVFLKYRNFLALTADQLLGLAHVPELFGHDAHIVLPLGISFYTLQAVGYLADVYLGKYPAERSFFRLSLFLSFFPCIAEGPIARYDETAAQLFAGSPLEPARCVCGIRRMLWGLMKKLIIADRVNIMVGEIYLSHSRYSGLAVVFAAVLYTVQIYADFSGMIDVSIGAGELFGVTVPENFSLPFLSQTVAEFWRRWHITLGAWLRDYVFYPLAMSERSFNLRRRAAKRLGPYYSGLLPTARAMFFVWLAMGFWHGSGWKYIVYGMYYFAIILAGMISEPWSARFCARLHIDRDGRPMAVFRTARTLVFVCIGMMLFRAGRLRVFLDMFRSIFLSAGTLPFLDGSIFTHGFDRKDLLVAAVGTAVMIAAGVLKARGVHLQALLSRQRLGVRWAVCFAMLFSIVIFGAYGGVYSAVDPIYAGF